MTRRSSGSTWARSVQTRRPDTTGGGRRHPRRCGAAALKSALGGRGFDAVADFLSFTPAHVANSLDVFEGHTGQYVFISSASAYQKPPAQLPITRSRRSEAGRTSRLIGRSEAIGEAYTITGSHAPTWNQIYGLLADAAGVAAPDIAHVASDTIAALAPDLGPTLLGDKAHSIVFDTSKVQALVPGLRTTVSFDEGARRILAYYDSHPEAQVVDPGRDAQFDRLPLAARGTDIA